MKKIKISNIINQYSQLELVNPDFLLLRIEIRKTNINPCRASKIKKIFLFLFALFLLFIFILFI